MTHLVYFRPVPLPQGERMGPNSDSWDFGGSPTPDRVGRQPNHKKTRSKPDFRPPYKPIGCPLPTQVTFTRESKLSQSRKTEKQQSNLWRFVPMATNTQEQQSQAGRHQEVGHKSLLQSDALYQVSSLTLKYPNSCFDYVEPFIFNQCFDISFWFY